MMIWIRRSKTRVTLLTLAAVLIGLSAGLVVWQGSSAGSATVVDAGEAADNAGVSSAITANAVEAGVDDIQDTSGATHSAEPRDAASEARTVAYTYDDAGRLLRVDYGNGTAITYTYDDAGNLLQREVVRAFVEFLPNVQR